MQEDSPLGEVQEEKPSRPPSNNNSSTKFNDLNVPNLASKFEELIEALPPLSMPTPRPSPAIGRQGAKRRRKGADSLLNKAAKSPMITQKKHQLQEEDDGIYCSLVDHRIGVWLPAPSTFPTNSNNTENSKKKTPSTSLHKNGAYCFGRIVGQEDLPPYRQIVEYDTPFEGKECSYVNLRTEIWVALTDDDVNITPNPSFAGRTAPPAAATTPDKRTEGTPTPHIRTAEEEITPETNLARPLTFLSPEHSPPPPLKIENEHFSVYKTTCGPQGYEIYAILPEILRIEDIKVKCFARGLLQFKVKQLATPQQKSNSDGSGSGGDGGSEAQIEQAPEEELDAERMYTVNLPSKIYPESARALFTSAGQLYLRVDSQKKFIATREKSDGKAPLIESSSEHKNE